MENCVGNFMSIMFQYIKVSKIAGIMLGCVRATRSLHDEVPGI